MVLRFVHYKKSKASGEASLVGISTLIQVTGHEDVFGTSIKDPVLAESAKKGAIYMTKIPTQSLVFDGLETRMAS